MMHAQGRRLGRTLLTAVLLVAAGAARADVAVPFPEYAARRKAQDIVHEPRWNDVQTRPDAYRGMILGYFLQVEGRIDSAGEARLICRSRSGDVVTVLCPGGCRVGDPKEWVGVLGGIPATGEPTSLTASMVSRISQPGPLGSDNRGAGTGTLPRGDTFAGTQTLPASQPGSSQATVPDGDAPPAKPNTAGVSTRPETAPPPKEQPAQSAQPVNQAQPGAFAPPYEMVRPSDLAVLENFISTCTSRLAPDMRRFIAAEIIRNAAQYSVRWEFFASIVAAESDFDPRCTSNKGAMGLAQIMPADVAETGISNPYDIRQNLAAGMACIRKELNRFLDRDPSTQLQLTLAAYNAGPGAVRKYGGVPPYRETIGYINRVTRHYLDLVSASAAAGR